MSAKDANNANVCPAQICLTLLIKLGVNNPDCIIFLPDYQ